MQKHHLTMVQYRALLLLHELGHDIGIFGPDADNIPLRDSYTAQVLIACLGGL